MDRKTDPEKQILIEDLLREAEEIDREIAEANMDPMPLDIKERIKSNLKNKIDEHEKEQLYASLSEADRKALEVGRKMLEKKENADADDKVAYRKKRIRMYQVLAAVLVLVLAMGVTSMGGAERVIEMVRVMIGTREIVRVNTDEDNYVVVDENEEAAYQEMREVFGVEPVKLIHMPKGTVFVMSHLEKELQIATLIYEFEGENIQFFISSHYLDSSWGIDNEDEVIDEYYIDQPEKGKLLIKEYESSGEKTTSYSVQFTHKGLEYYLTGIMAQEEFEDIIKNLKFF